MLCVKSTSDSLNRCFFYCIPLFVFTEPFKKHISFEGSRIWMFLMGPLYSAWLVFNIFKLSNSG